MSYFDDMEDRLTGIPRWVERIAAAQDRQKGATTMADSKQQAQRNATKVVTGEVRLSYCHLFEPFAFDNEEPKYSVMLIIPKSDKATMERIKRAQKAAIEMGVTTKWNGKKPKSLYNTLKDGDEMDGEEFANSWVLRASSKTAPGVVDGALNPITDSTEVYSGCYGRVSLNFFPYSAMGNNGISAGLNNVQFIRDGEPLGGRSRAEDDFDVYEDPEADQAPWEDDYDDILG